ncbi:hypothetical protein DFJ58DRAFT_914479 [Suillus subalutaceus]|uniref:uncharacterized protein n=1 Tax=Suillus subalutaceus TaxID=48586 RepID=UPI001B85FABA|nr:uncharacterized protein DFJ58DRAFT_914479 [Suillus subalutaceus]KAG1851877.1 hypothetical protein DFJ58DRAFT_914479 [Suillus subalutaceus]
MPGSLKDAPYYLRICFRKKSQSPFQAHSRKAPTYPSVSTRAGAGNQSSESYHPPNLVWADTVFLYKFKEFYGHNSRSLDASPVLSLEIKASFELDRMLDNGEVVGKYHGMRCSIMEMSLSMMKTRVTSSFAAIGQSSPSTRQNKTFLVHDSELELVPATVNTITLATTPHEQDREQPYYSHFAMKDEPLTLLDIMENDTPQAEFAFLSACHTVVGDEKSPDQVIHLAVGLQFSGFKVSLKLSFYENTLKDLEDGVMYYTKAAWALNRVTCAVKTKVLLEQRMVFIYVGFRFIDFLSFIPSVYLS